MRGHSQGQPRNGSAQTPTASALNPLPHPTPMGPHQADLVNPIQASRATPARNAFNREPALSQRAPLQVRPASGTVPIATRRGPPQGVNQARQTEENPQGQLDQEGAGSRLPRHHPAATLRTNNLPATKRRRTRRRTRSARGLRGRGERRGKDERRLRMDQRHERHGHGRHHGRGHHGRRRGMLLAMLIRRTKDPGTTGTGLQIRGRIRELQELTARGTIELHHGRPFKPPFKAGFPCCSQCPQGRPLSYPTAKDFTIMKCKNGSCFMGLPQDLRDAIAGHSREDCLRAAAELERRARLIREHLECPCSEPEPLPRFWWRSTDMN